MVRLTKNVGSGLSVSVEGETFIEAFEQMAAMEDCFEPNPKNPNGEVRLRVRNSKFMQNGKEKDATYHELVDVETGAVLALGSHDGDKKGSLFPKRRGKRNEDGSPGPWLDNRGWVIFKKEDKEETPKPATKATSKGKPKADDEIPFGN